MKICMISELVGGGVEKVNVGLANGFVDAGNNVTIIANKPPIHNIVENIKCATVFLNKKSKSWTLIALWRIIVQMKPDIVVAVSFLDIFLMNIIVKTMSLETKIIYVQHSVYSKSSLHSTKQKIITYYLPRLVSMDFLVDGLIFVSQGVKNDFLKFFPEYHGKSKVVYNPISNNKLTLNYKPIADKLRLVTAGRLEVEKNQQMLISVVEQLLNDGTNCQLSIYGEGSQLETLDRIVENKGLSNNIIFEGFSDDLTKILGNYDVFLLSSEHESFGNVLVEALNQGLPIVSTDCPVGPAEILENGKYGTLVDAGDAIAMKNAIYKEIRTYSPAIQERNYRRSMEFSRDKSIQRYLEFFADCCL